MGKTDMKNLKSFKELADAFAGNVEQMPVAFATAAEVGATLVKEVARAKIGHYQEAVGPFNKWDDLKPATVAQKKALGYADDENDNPLLRTGEMRDSIKSESSPAGFIVGSTSPIAGYQEFGTEHIQPRPFIGPALFESTPGILRAVGATVERTLAGEKP